MSDATFQQSKVKPYPDIFKGVYVYDCHSSLPINPSEYSSVNLSANLKDLKSYIIKLFLGTLIEFLFGGQYLSMN